MAFVITEASEVKCPDSGTATLKPTPKLTVAGKGVVVKTDLAGATIGGCKNPASTSSKPCTAVAAVVSGGSKITIGGSKVVMLASLVATSDAAPPPHNQITGDAKQTKLSAAQKG